MRTPIFTGCGTAISTPFSENGVNFDEFRKLIENQIEEGIDAIIVCGTTGESSTMTEKEKKDTIKFAVDVAKKRVPIIAGTGGNNTYSAIEMSKYAESVGADGLLVVTPYYNKCTQSGLIKHYEMIANSVSLPIIVYSVKSRTGVNIEPKTAFELSKIPNIARYKRSKPEISLKLQRLQISAKITYLFIVEMTTKYSLYFHLVEFGVISVLSNIAPKKTTQMVHNFLERKNHRSKKASNRKHTFNFCII